MGASSAYLILYNFVQAGGWALILVELVKQITGCGNGVTQDLMPSWFPEVAHGHVCVDSSTNGKIIDLLDIFQTAAILEIIHAMLGLVKSKVGVVFPQVLSRVIVLWLIVHVSPEANQHSGFTLMGFAWAITEVIRYSWYGLKLLLGDAPFFLTYLRYTLFIVLYPIGVYGENVCIWATAAHVLKLANATEDPTTSYVLTGVGYLMYCLTLVYFPAFPPLYLHMFAQRKKTINPRKPRPVSEEGIQFPKDPKGVRSSSAVGQAAFAMSVAKVDSSAAVAVFKERNWRFGYAKHVVKNVQVCCKSEEACLAVARAGLEYCYNTFEFIQQGKVMTLKEAMQQPISNPYFTKVIKGDGEKREDYVVPYRKAAYPKVSELLNLTKDELLKQLSKWATEGSIEPSAEASIAAVVKNKKWIDLSDTYFVLLGAGSAMGPYEVLMSLGANVIAIDLDLPHIWKRLITIAKSSSGTLILPVKVDPTNLSSEEELHAQSGSNLFTDTPRIADWLKTIYPSESLVIGGYAYLDGERHVRVSLAMDAIMSSVISGRKTTTTLGFLCSPTDVFVVDKEAKTAVAENKKKLSTFTNTVCGLLKMFAPKSCASNLGPSATSADGKHTYEINDGVIVAQGPNYALAKRIQHWRAMLARSEGSPVSTNIAPSTATISVVHNAQFAAAYGGFQFIAPLEVAFQETSNAVMAALLIHDIRSPKSKADAKKMKLANPIQLFAPGSFHGGIWRAPYKIGSIGEATVVLHYIYTGRFYLVASLVAAVAGVAVVALDN